MVFLQLLSIYITFLPMVNIRLVRAGKRSEERRSVIALHLHYFPADGERSFGEEGRGIGERRLRSNKVIELRVEPQKKEQKKRASKISLRSSLILKKAATYSPALHCSTIGADGLNFSVRNGKRWNPDAITT